MTLVTIGELDAHREESPELIEPLGMFMFDRAGIVEFIDIP
jgi:hypothetical protein